MAHVSLIARILVIVGALNWGLMGLFGFDLVVAVLGFMPVLVKAVYVLVGASGVLAAWDMYNIQSK